MLRSTLLFACLIFATCSSTRVIPNAKTRLLKQSQSTITCHTDSDCDNNHHCDNNGQCQARPIADIANGPMGCCTSTVPNNSICHSFTDQTHCETPTNNNCSWITTHNPTDCVDYDTARFRTARFRTAPNATKLIVGGDDMHTADTHRCVGIGGDDAINAHCYEQTDLGRSACEMMPLCVWIDTDDPIDFMSRRRLAEETGVDPATALATAAITSGVSNLIATAFTNWRNRRKGVFTEITLNPDRPQVFIEILNHFPKHTLYRVQEYLDPSTVKQAKVPAPGGQAKGDEHMVAPRPDTIPADGVGIVGLYQSEYSYVDAARRKGGYGDFSGIVRFALAPDDVEAQHLYRCLYLKFGTTSKLHSHVSAAIDQSGDCTSGNLLQRLQLTRLLAAHPGTKTITDDGLRAAWIDDGLLQIRLTSEVEAPRKFKVDVYPCPALDISHLNSLGACTKDKDVDPDVVRSIQENMGENIVHPEGPGTSGSAATQTVQATARASAADVFLKSFDEEIGDSPRRPVLSRHSQHSDFGAKRYIRHSASEQPKDGQYHPRVSPH